MKNTKQIPNLDRMARKANIQERLRLRDKKNSEYNLYHMGDEDEDDLPLDNSEELKSGEDI